MNICNQYCDIFVRCLNVAENLTLWNSDALAYFKATLKTFKHNKTCSSVNTDPLGYSSVPLEVPVGSQHVLFISYWKFQMLLSFKTVGLTI